MIFTILLSAIYLKHFFQFFYLQKYSSSDAKQIAVHVFPKLKTTYKMKVF